MSGERSLRISSLNIQSPFGNDRTVQWTGSVTSEAAEKATSAIEKLLKKNQTSPITLVVTSPGGTSGTAMSFYDTMRLVYKPLLHTIGSGDVDSAGIIIFLTGSRRFISPNTTLLLHLAGRIFPAGKRVTTMEMEAMLKEDKLKDFQYASIVSEQSGGRLTTQEVLDLMANNTVLTPADAVEYGLAHEILN